MLVSTALVVIMMYMFSTIFQMAAGAISTQRGIATNDQRARTMTTIIRADLEARTFKNLIPFEAGETDLYTDARAFGNREGYFYVSENDVYSDADDVLQFTIGGTDNPDVAPYFGAAFALGDTDSNQNQPEWDDGQFTSQITGDPSTEIRNGSGTSPVAEVSYFLRNGNLYRRVLLLRKPLDTSLPGEEQPDDDVLMARFFDPNYPMAGGRAYPTGYTVALLSAPAVTFWHDFDYSAHRDIVNGAQFHRFDASLDNDPATGVYPLGIPLYRFGHNHDAAAVPPGLPREFFDDPGADLTFGMGGDDAPKSLFFGRFTHEETSHANFQYPAGDSTNLATADPINDGNPMFQGSTVNRLTLSGGIAVGVGPDDQLGTIDDASLTGGLRRAEDILLSNVHSFDVKLYDDGLGDFVDVGHGGTDGHFNFMANQQPNYGPYGAVSNGLDSQPGVAGVDDDLSGVADDGLVFVGLDGQPGVAGVDDDGVNGVDDVGELGWPGSDDLREEGFPGSDDQHNRVFDTWHPQFDFDGDTMFNDPPPYRPALEGPDGGFGAAGIDDDGDTVADNPEEYGWPLTDDFIGIRAIKITIRFHDRKSDQLRQVTLVYPLTAQE